jgi:hypothetical protein
VTDSARDHLAPAQKAGAARGAASARIPAWAEALARWLDDLVRIPGTRVGFGLDGVLGLLVPGAGDAISGVGSLALLLLALRRGLPSIVIARMVLNIGVDALVGTIPIVGDLFDFGFKANRRNLELIRSYEADMSKRPGPGDYALVGLGFVFALLSVLLPIAVAAFVVGRIAEAWH